MKINRHNWTRPLAWVIAHVMLAIINATACLEYVMEQQGYQGKHLANLIHWRGVLWGDINAMGYGLVRDKRFSYRLVRYER